MSSRRSSPTGRLLWGILAVTLLFTIAVKLMSARVDEGEAQPVGLIVAVIAGLIVLAPALVYASAKHWRGLDEAAQEAHKWAWFWGGSLGMAPAVLITAVPSVSLGLAERLGYRSPGDLVQFGAGAVLAFMIAGYFIAWGLWWFRRR